MVSQGRLKRSDLLIGLLVAALAACGSDGGDGDGDGDADAGDRQLPPAAANLDRDILSTRLEVNVGAQSATAIIGIAADASGAASFEIGDLEIMSVADSLGPLNFEDVGDTLNVGVPSDTTELLVEYQYSFKQSFDGVLQGGLTFAWPYFCGNIFPCHSDPSDGLELELDITGLAAGETAVFAADTMADAPSYMLAWAIGDYAYTMLGMTDAGTEVGTYVTPAEAAAMASGTPNLVGAFDWLEKNVGPYIYGSKVASVSAAWGPGAFGGMEHHPLWHVSTGSLTSQETHAHEAAHGWFGNGIRIACWEDFVLSEGTVSYLAARSLEEVAGTAVSDPIWAGYRSRLDGGIAWPDGCNAIDIIEDGLFSSAPYVKGALFYRSLEARVGRPAFDAALASFYQANRGRAARMSDMIAHFATETGYDATACAMAWLRSQTIPAQELCE